MQVQSLLSKNRIKCGIPLFVGGTLVLNCHSHHELVLSCERKKQTTF